MDAKIASKNDLKNNKSNNQDLKIAKAFGRSLNISTKYAIETCNYLRGKELSKAKKILERVLEKKEAIPFRRFTDGVGHRKGKVGAGRYPKKTAEALLSLFNSVEANATNLGLLGELKIVELRANKAPKPLRGGRRSGREMKRTHVYITVQEIPGTKRVIEKKKKAKKSKEEKKNKEKGANKEADNKKVAAKELKKEEKNAKTDIKTDIKNDNNNINNEKSSKSTKPLTKKNNVKNSAKKSDSNKNLDKKSKEEKNNEKIKDQPNNNNNKKINAEE